MASKLGSCGDSFGRSVPKRTCCADCVLKILAITLAIVITDGTSASLSHAQSPISASPGVHISIDNPQAPFAETFLAVNPRDARNLVATSLVGIDGEGRSLAYASRDGGRTWQRSQTTAPDNPIFAGASADTMVYFDASGTAFLGTMLLPQTSESRGLEIRFVVSRSTDGGFTWQPSVALQGGSYDRPYLAIDKTGNEFHGRMYVGGRMNSIVDTSGKRHGGVGIADSVDGGRTFSFRRFITGNGLDCGPYGPTGVADLLVTPEGHLVVPMLCGSPGPPASTQVWTMVSEDGGFSFSSAQRGPSYSSDPEKGFRWAKNISVPRAAVDLSDGLYRGRIYLSYSDFDGQKYVVKVAYSTDKGKTWSAPVVVSDNPKDADVANPAIAVNKDGVVGVVFNDRRDDPKNSCFRLYFTASVDGGQTFLPNLRASEQPTCPFAPGNWALTAMNFPDSVKMQRVLGLLAFPMRYANGGDTQGLIAGPDGVFHSSWINGESGVMQLWFKDFRVDRTAALRAHRSDSRKDLSADLTLEVTEPRVDFGARKVCTKIRLVNALSVAVSGPFTVVLDDITSYFQDLRALDSDNGLSGKGAAWNFGGKPGLEPHQKSDERVLCWSFSGSVPDEPKSFVPHVLTAHFFILGRAQTP